MTRIAALVLVLTGCATTTHDIPTLSAAAGVRRLGPAVSTTPAASKDRHRRRHTLPTSRYLHRRSLPARLLTITGYCYTGSRNAAGNWPTVGTAAANAYPLGTRLDVQGYGVVTVEDRSAPAATDVDLYLGSDSGCEARAIAWGRRLLHVTEIR